jgi:chaperone protein EcpD
MEGPVSKREITMFTSRLIALGIGLLLISTNLYATLQINTTRIIMAGNKKDTSVRINNVGSSPSLTKVWLSDAETKGLEGGNDRLPFFISPPAALIDAGEAKVFRFLKLDDAESTLLQDRETVLWFNVMDIPSKKESDQDKNGIEMVFRTIIKFFYRPAGLKGTPILAAEDLSFTYASSGNKTQVKVTNNHPYHVSVNKVSFDNGAVKKEGEAGMIAPFSNKTFTFDGINPGMRNTIEYRYITDLGAMITINKSLK